MGGGAEGGGRAGSERSCETKGISDAGGSFPGDGARANHRRATRPGRPVVACQVAWSLSIRASALRFSSAICFAFARARGPDRMWRPASDRSSALFIRACLALPSSCRRFVESRTWTLCCAFVIVCCHSSCHSLCRKITGIRVQSSLSKPCVHPILLRIHVVPSPPRETVVREIILSRFPESRNF